MKYLIPLLFLTSCTLVRHPVAGVYASFGGKTLAHKQDADGFSFAENDNATAFVAVIKQVRVMWQSYLVAEGLKFVSGLYYDHKGAVVASDQAVKLEGLRNANSVEMAKLKLEELKLTPEVVPTQ